MAPPTSLYRPYFSIQISPQARLSYLALASVARSSQSPLRPRAYPRPLRTFSTQRPCRSDDSGKFVRSDFDGQGFTGFYEPPVTHGPLSGASSVGAPKIIPKELKAHLDSYVVGQERAKKKLSTAIYNHYQRIEELRRREREEEEAAAQQERRERAFRHPVEGTFALSSVLSL